MAVGYLTSSTLIASVKRRALIPSNQKTFKDADFLALANEETHLGLVPSVLSYHEEYFTYEQLVPLVSNQSAYSIPYRAIGGKLRDICYKTSSGNLVPMTRISPEDRVHYQQGSNSTSTPNAFYLRGNDVVIVPDLGSAPTGNLVFLYYLRPNDLVDESRVSVITSIDTSSKSIKTISTGAGTVTITVSGGHGLTSGDYIRISNSNSTPVIDGLYSVTVVTSTTFTISTTVTIAGSSGLFKVGKISCVSVPSNITAGSSVDILQAKSGHKTRAFDITARVANSTNLVIQLDPSDIPSDLVAGDHIASAGECMIPQVPSDLHPVLAQRVAARCLEALGDTQGLTNANTKLEEMEKKTGSLVDDRTEGEPQKVNNWNSPLHGARRRRRGWY